MKTINVYQVDAFTDELFSGNPAGVVTDADVLTEREMQSVAREMSLSETAFVLTPSNADAAFKLRYFTPTNEVKFCGHATIGTLFQLAQLRKYGLGETGRHEVCVETGVGIVEMTVTNDADGIKIACKAPDTAMQEYRLQGAAFATAFGIDPGVITAGATIHLDDGPQRFVFVPVTSSTELHNLQYDTARVRNKFADEHIIIFCFYTAPGTDGAGVDLQARSFGPLIGLVEDPFTGAIQAGLMRAAKSNGLIDPAKDVLRVEQGSAMGRPGFATITHDDTTDTVTIEAHAVQVFATRMEF